MLEILVVLASASLLLWLVEKFFGHHFKSPLAYKSWMVLAWLATGPLFWFVQEPASTLKGILYKFIGVFLVFLGCRLAWRTLKTAARQRSRRINQGQFAR